MNAQSSKEEETAASFQSFQPITSPPPVSVVKLNEPNTRNILIHGGEEVVRVRSVDRREEVSSFQLSYAHFSSVRIHLFDSREKRRTECFQWPRSDENFKSSKQEKKGVCG